jgi:ubiquinone/menaquinone biosynthesis C-methylase UbiE
MRIPQDAALAPPLVSSEAYDTQYFLHRCAGAADWLAGRRDPLYEGCLRLAGLRAGEALLDVGTGRGELLVAALELGARQTVGVEYSAAAVALARATIDRSGAADRAEVRLADARALPLADGLFDLVTMLDVVEHLGGDELATALTQARRVLAPGGRIFIHTFPTRTLYELTYRLHRAARPGRRRRWPRDPRNDLERAMHVGEQTVGSMRRALDRAGFERVRVWPGRWMYTEFVPDPRARRLYYRLARVPPLRRFGAADLWAQAYR